MEKGYRTEADEFGVILRLVQDLNTDDIGHVDELLGHVHKGIDGHLLVVVVVEQVGLPIADTGVVLSY